MALGVALEFVPGTTDPCKALVAGMFDAGELLAAYRTACLDLHSRDLVLVSTQSDPSMVSAKTRENFLREVRGNLGRLASRASLWMPNSSAHAQAKLPADSDAFWLVVIRNQEIPITVGLFALPYDEAAQGMPLIGEA